MYYGSVVECVQFGCFRRGSTSLHSNFTWTGSPPSNRSWHRKLETLGYTWRWKPHPSAFPRFDTISECDGQTNGQTERQTDGRTDGRICVAYTGPAKLAMQSAVKTNKQVDFVIQQANLALISAYSVNLTFSKHYTALTNNWFLPKRKPVAHSILDDLKITVLKFKLL